jgi:arylsulfatase A-like enzyme
MVLRGLEERGLADNTIVIYHADHGCYHMIHGISEKAPGICSDAVCRIPMIWRVPGITRPGHTTGALVENLDLAPTLTDLCGLPPMPSADGHSLTPLLRGEEVGLRDLAVTENAWSKAAHFDRWRFVHYPRHMFGEDVGELYDRLSDPDETRNLYHDPHHRDVVEECRRALMDWLILTTRNHSPLPAAAGAPQRGQPSALKPMARDLGCSGSRINYR